MQGKRCAKLRIVNGLRKPQTAKSRTAEKNGKALKLAVVKTT